MPSCAIVFSFCFPELLQVMSSDLGFVEWVYYRPDAIHITQTVV